MFRHLKAAVFDWAGTVIDHGSIAPIKAFVKAFAEFGVAVTIDEARGPMGMAKRPHIATLMRLPRVAEAWKVRHGRAPEEADIDRLFAVFLPMNIKAAEEHSALIGGTAVMVERLRAGGLRIGTTTGYTHDIMDAIRPLAAKQGFRPDCVIGTGDTPEGRPSPFMLWRAMSEMGVWPAAAVLKIDDTEVGIGEGLNGGAWAIGVAMTGNACGLDEAEAAALGEAERAALRAQAAAKLWAAGAHHVIDGIADLWPVAMAIEGRLERGERP